MHAVVSLPFPRAGSATERARGISPTRQVGHVAQEPDEEEGHGQAIGALGPVVLDELGQLAAAASQPGVRSVPAEEARICWYGSGPASGRHRTRHHTHTQLTKRHTQAVRLTVPNTPDRVCSSDGRAATAPDTDKSAVMVLLCWPTVGARGSDSEGTRKRGTARERRRPACWQLLLCATARRRPVKSGGRARELSAAAATAMGSCEADFPLSGGLALAARPEISKGSQDLVQLAACGAHSASAMHGWWGEWAVAPLSGSAGCLQGGRSQRCLLPDSH